MDDVAADADPVLDVLSPTAPSVTLADSVAVADSVEVLVGVAVDVGGGVGILAGSEYSVAFAGVVTFVVVLRKPMTC